LQVLRLSELSLQQLTSTYRRRWASVNRWKEPGQGDTLTFLASEAAELIKAICEVQIKASGYTRNHPDKVHTMAGVTEEIVGVLLMSCILCDHLGIELESAYQDYLEVMDAKRL
jgi:NTP pyrophosphatase (non-canonical NTP hydrolase)